MVMAKFTVDGPNLLLIAKAGVTSVNVETDLYSDAKEHWLATTDNKYNFPFRAVAGDPISPVKFLEGVFFLTSGWKIRPDEADHELLIEGNLYLDEGETPGLIIPTLGGYTVLATIERSSDARAVVVDQDDLVRETRKTQYLIETGIRTDHGGVGTLIFLDPVNGDDANDGLAPEEDPDDAGIGPVLTWAAAYGIAVDGHHDVIQLVQTSAGTTLIANAVIAKRDLQVRGPGTQFTWKPASDATAAIRVTASDVGLQGFRITGAATGTADLIEVDGENCAIRGILLDASRRHAVKINDGASRAHIHNCEIDNAASNGVDLGEAIGVRIGGGKVHDCTNGIFLNTPAAPPFNGYPEISDILVHGNSGVGITIPSGFQNATLIRTRTFNNGTDFTNNEATTRIDQTLELVSFEGAVYIDTVGGVAGTAFPLGTPTNPTSNLADALLIAAQQSLKTLRVHGSITLTSAMVDWTFIGMGMVDSTINLNGQDVSSSKFEHVQLVGDAASPDPVIDLEHCWINGVSNLKCTGRACTLQGSNSLGSGQSFFLGCASGVPGTGTPIIDFQGGDTTMSMRAYSGGLEIRGMSTAQNISTCEWIAGQCIIDSSCTAGTLVLRGIVYPITDNNAGTNVDDTGALKPFDVALLRYQGAIWINTANGTAGTTVGENGTPELPVDTLADALTLSDVTGLKHFVIVSGSLTLTASLNEAFVELRDESELNFGGQDVNGTEFLGGMLKGTMTGVIQVHGHHTEIEDVVGLRGTISNAGLTGTITLGAGLTHLANCHSHVPGTATPTIIFGDATAKLSMRGYSGGVELQGMAAAGNISTCEFIAGQLLIDSTCSAGELIVRGIVAPVTDNSTGTLVDTRAVVQPVSRIVSSFAVDPTTDALEGNLWLERNGQFVLGVVSASASFYDVDGNLLFAEADASPTNGVFKVAKATPGFTAGSAVYVIQSIVEASGTVTTAKGVQPVG